MPVYIGKSGDLVGCYRCLTDTQTTEYRATQLLSSIQFKLSHTKYLEVDGCPTPSFNLLRLSLLLGEKFLKFLQFFFFAAAEIFHRSSGVGRLLPLRSDMKNCEILKIFTFFPKTA